MEKLNEPLALAAYEQLAGPYAARVDTKPHNAYYDRPAVLSLLPALEGLQVLDAGCGPGAYAEALVGRGAQVHGIDVSPAMLAEFRARLGDRARADLWDLGTPLSLFEDGRFDGIVSALALDYVLDWRAVMAEFRRITRPGGWLVFSCEHPASAWRMRWTDSYHAVEVQSTPWRGFGTPVVVPSYRRPLSAVLNPVLEAGYRLDGSLEPLPTDDFAAADPAAHAELMREPGFLCVRARREG